MCESRSPLQLGAPQDVLLPVHQDGEVLVLPLFDGVGVCSDGTHLPELKNNTHSQTDAIKMVAHVETRRLVD